MDKDEIRRLVKNAAFIPGIYNYCDRWCERCAFTSHCANYAVSEAHFSGPGDRDLSNKRFWDKLSEVLQVTLDMLHEEAGLKRNSLRPGHLCDPDSTG